MIDIHTHILPGVDDGSPDLETSLRMARLAVEDGITSVVCTPHMAVEHPFPPGFIGERVAQLAQALQEAGIPLQVLPGAEIVLSAELPRYASMGKLPTLGEGSRHLLIELPFVGTPVFAEQVFFELQLAGYTPVIAHPERSNLGLQQPKVLEQLAERGILLQVNVTSLLGREGPHVRRLALKLIRQGTATLIASDAHNAHDRVPVLSSCRRLINRLRKPGLFEALTCDNPGRVIGRP